MDLRDPVTKTFIKEFQSAYDTDALFNMKEYNDCWVFDEVRKSVIKRHPTWKWNDWCRGIIKGEGHPLINSEWGAYLDHLKGNRKKYGKSLKTDLIVRRVESYWR
jgi:hypothetical protein